MNIHYIYGAVLKIKSKSNKFKKMSDYIETLPTNYNYRLSEFIGDYSDVESHYKATFHARPFMHPLLLPPKRSRMFVRRRLGAGRLGAGPYARGNRIL